MYEYKFPDVGEGITEGTLVKWLVKEGDEIRKDQTVANVETDKAVVEIPSPVNGTVLKLLAEEHQTIFVGKPFILINDGTTGFNAPDQFISKSAVKEKSRLVEEQKSVPQPPPEKIIPTESASFYAPKQMNFSEIVLAMPSARKRSKEKGVDLHMVRSTGKHGQILLKDVESYIGQGISMNYLQSQIQQQIVIPQNATPVQLSTPRQTSPIISQDIPRTIIHHDRSEMSEILAAPSTRQLARDLNIDILKVKGTGHDGLITRQDIENAAKLPEPRAAAQAAAILPNTSSIARATTDKIDIEGNEIIPLTQIRQAISRRMSQSWNNAVHVMVSDEADVTELVNIQKKNAETYLQHNIRLTFLPFFVKATILALQKNPKLNATLDEENSRIIQKHYYNIGIAADTEAGLMVPVIKNAETKNIPQLAIIINDLATRARNKSLKLEEMSNGTFTVTNIGSIAGQLFTQILNYPEAAILGIGRIVDKPVVKNGSVQIRKIVVLSVTADHRIIDGADVARFLKTLIGYVENPDDMFMEMML